MFKSWRLLAVALLSYSSGAPLGLVWIAIPTWMATLHVDIKVVGLFTLAQAPWSFKFLWSPLMDRYAPPFGGRKRGWIVIAQAGLVALGLAMAAVADRPNAVALIAALTLAMGFVAASQDIAYDGYAVEVLEREEQGAAVGARLALYRLAMIVAGGVAIYSGARWGWSLVHVAVALVYLPFMFVAWRAPEPAALPPPPRSLREAVWGPFVGMLAQHRALEILAFVVLYKLSDNLSQSLIRPFLVQAGYNPFDVGIATLTLGTVALIAGTMVGGVLTTAIGLGPALWISGLLQLFANLGYALVAQVGHDRPLMYAAQAFEMGTAGMGSGALGVMLLRLTQKRFSATQYALLSSLFSLPRVLAGPVAGLLADAIGWRNFFVASLVAGVPGLVMLQRFSPWGLREPEFHVAPPSRGVPRSRSAVAIRAVAGAVAGGFIAWLALATLAGVRAVRKGGGFELGARIADLAAPATLADALSLAGVGLVSLAAGLATAATLVARHGIRDSAKE